MSDADDDHPVNVPRFSSFGGDPQDAGKQLQKLSSRDLAAPKFGSFKPKQNQLSARPKAVANDRLKRRSDGREKSSYRDAPRSRDTPRFRDGRHKSDGHHLGRVQEDIVRQDQVQKAASFGKEVKPQLKDALQPNSIYWIDTKGDRLITKYGGIHKSEIPFYHRGRRGKVLGTDGRLFIHRDGPRDEFSLIMPGERMTFKHNSGLRSKFDWTKRSSLRVLPEKSLSVDQNEDSFIPVGKGTKSLSDSSSSSEDEGPSYRSIQGKAKVTEESGDDMKSHSDSEAISSDREQKDPLKWKSMELNKILRVNPQDIGAWLELIDHQDVLLQDAVSSDDSSFHNAALSFAEIKVSMLESAISKISVNSHRDLLLCALMREGSKIWSSQKCSQKWSEIEAEERESFDIWKEHLNFVMSDISNFHYSIVFKMLLNRFQQALVSLQHNQSEEPALGEAIYTLFRATRFIHEAGYKELALAIWQANLELLFFPPDAPDNTLDNFQDFWEDEVARIGDSGAKGWLKYFEARGTQESLESSLEARETLVELNDPYSAWANLENRCARQAELPAKTMDGGNEDDPFRVIMFSDIRPWLLILPERAAISLKLSFAEHFLMFCGFPPALLHERRHRPNLQDFFFRRVNTENLRDRRTESLSEDHHKATLHKDNSLVLEVACTPDILFGDSRWFRWASNSHRTIVNVRWIRNVLKSLVHDAGVEALGLYYLALTLEVDAAQVKKSAKALLKQYSNNINLYNAFALCEVANGNHDSAQVVLELCMTKCSNLTDLVRLSRALCQIKIEREELERAIQVLASLADSISADPRFQRDQQPNGYQKPKLILTGYWKMLFAEGDYENVVDAACCSVLYAYLTAPGESEPTSIMRVNVSAAAAILNDVHTTFSSKASDQQSLETILQFGAKLLFIHASGGPYRRAFMQKQISSFLARFPNNTVFLRLLEWFDPNLRILDELRNHLQEVLCFSSRECLTSHVFAIQHEMDRGSVHSTKKAFERGVSGGGRLNADIWVWYLRFCVSETELRKVAKQVFFRGLRHCPWSKVLMMEGFTTLRTYMESAELKALYERMELKGIRLHTDLAQFSSENGVKQNRALNQH